MNNSEKLKNLKNKILQLYKQQKNHLHPLNISELNKINKMIFNFRQEYFKIKKELETAEAVGCIV